jgi:hypothetical protein
VQFLLFLVSVSIFVQNHFIHERKLVGEGEHSRTTQTFDVASIVLYIWLVIREVLEMIRLGESYFRDFWNYVDVGMLVMFFICFSLAATNQYHHNEFPAILMLLMFMKLLYFARGFRKTGLYVALLYSVVASNLEVLLVLFVILSGFSQAFVLLHTHDEESSDAFTSTGKGIVTLFAGLFGNISLSDFSGLLEYVFLFLFLLVAGMLFMNLVSATINNTMGKIFVNVRIVCTVHTLGS